MERRLFVQAAAMGIAALTATAAASVFDDAAVWWKFDEGGADGAVARAGEIHDARDASLNVAQHVYGMRGGPVWTNMAVRLPFQRTTVRSTALYFPCDTREVTVNGLTSNQYWYASANMTGCRVAGQDITVVARVRLSGEDISEADCIFLNNGFHYSQKLGHAIGFIKYTTKTRGPDTVYAPYAFFGQKTMGNAAGTKRLTMRAGEWYDVAWILRAENGTNYATYVVAGADGIRRQQFSHPSNYGSGDAKNWTVLGSMNENGGWAYYDPVNYANLSGDRRKSFSGCLHQVAIWDRTLSADEVEEAFGRPSGGEDVFADASHWWRFDRDLNGDGLVDFAEMRDLRFWNQKDERGEQLGDPRFNLRSGPFGGPLWTNAAVYLPGRGVTVETPCMYVPVATNTATSGDDEVAQMHMTRISASYTATAGSKTILARIRPMHHWGAIGGVRGFFYNNGLNWNDWSGCEVGLAPNGTSGTNFWPTIVAAHATYDFKNLPMTADKWYDVAYSITDAGKDADGKDLTDTALVAVYDADYGLRVQTANISTNAYTEYASYGTVMVGAEQTQGLKPFYNLTTQSQVSYGNAAKCYHGLIHQIAVWDRALTVDEIAAAFGHPNSMVMGVGSGDGTGDEFAAAGEGSYDWTLDESWHGMAATLDAAHPDLTIRFTPDANNVALVHMLHLKAAAAGTAAGQTATVSLRLNGKSLASAKEVSAGEDLWCIVPKNALAAGENALRITHGGGGSLVLDKVEIVGSWQLGVQDTQNYEFSQEGGGRGNDYYVGNRHVKNVIRAVTSGVKNTYLHFHVPAEVATNHTFTFTSAVSDQSGASNADNSFRILLNGVEKYASPPDRKMTKGEEFAFEVEKGGLQAGWNAINIQLTGTNWISFDFFRMGISDYSPGTFLMVR